jgi:GT2 family glycosyltransferase
MSLAREGRPAVACVVLNWNGAEDTLRCVESLLASRNVRLDVVIVDNGSTDDSVKELGERFPNVALLRQANNVGVAQGFNIGLEWATGRGVPFVFFLNNDATVEHDCVSILLGVFDGDALAGICSPRIIDGTRAGRMWSDGGGQNAFRDPVHVGMFQPIRRGAEPRPEVFATGCAMMVRASVFAAVGRFDERFFAYSEDVDFCVRARREGWSIFHVPKALATHYPSSATKRNRGKWYRDYYVTRNKLLLLHSELSRLRWVWFLGYFSLRYLIVPTLFFLMTAQFRRVHAVWSGVYDFVQKRFGRRYS